MYLTIPSFMNTAITSLVLLELFNVNKTQVVNGNYKFVYDIMFIYLYVTFYGPLYNIFDAYYYVMQWCPRKIALHRGENNHLT